MNRKFLKTEFKYEMQNRTCYCQWNLVEDNGSTKIYHCSLCPNICTQYYEIMGEE